MTMTLVSTVTVGSGGAASIEWTGIPATGTDLLVVFSLRATNAGTTLQDLRIYINGLTSGYSDRSLFGNGSTVGSSSDGAGGGYWYIEQGADSAGATASTFSNGQLYLTNYAGATAKSGSLESVTENNAALSKQNLLAVRNSTTSAITSVKLETSNLGLAQYSTASLYTITKGSGGATVS